MYTRKEYIKLDRYIVAYIDRLARDRGVIGVTLSGVLLMEDYHQKESRVRISVRMEEYPGIDIEELLLDHFRMNVYELLIDNVCYR